MFDSSNNPKKPPTNPALWPKSNHQAGSRSSPQPSSQGNRHPKDHKKSASKAVHFEVIADTQGMLAQQVPAS
jgi:hypothetical protein